MHTYQNQNESSPQRNDNIHNPCKLHRSPSPPTLPTTSCCTGVSPSRVRGAGTGVPAACAPTAWPDLPLGRHSALLCRSWHAGHLPQDHLMCCMSSACAHALPAHVPVASRGLSAGAAGSRDWIRPPVPLRPGGTVALEGIACETDFEACDEEECDVEVQVGWPRARVRGAGGLDQLRRNSVHCTLPLAVWCCACLSHHGCRRIPSTAWPPSWLRPFHHHAGRQGAPPARAADGAGRRRHRRPHVCAALGRRHALVSWGCGLGPTGCCACGP